MWPGMMGGGCSTDNTDIKECCQGIPKLLAVLGYEVIKGLKLQEKGGAVCRTSSCLLAWGLLVG